MTGSEQSSHGAYMIHDKYECIVNFAYSGNPDRAHADMAKLARAFFIPEHVDLAAAMAIVKKPR